MLLGLTGAPCNMCRSTLSTSCNNSCRLQAVRSRLQEVFFVDSHMMLNSLICQPQVLLLQLELPLVLLMVACLQHEP